MNREEMKKAVRQLPTPFYVYDASVFINRIHTLLEPLQKNQIGLTYSMKANPFMVQIASKYTERIEVCSYGEFEICKNLHIPAGKLLLSGVLKEKEQTIDMVQYGSDQALYTAESTLQLELLNEAARKNHTKIHVLLRLTSGNQFGMDEETIKAVLLNRNKYDSIEIIGLHFFSGTKKKNLKKTTKELTELDSFIEKMETETDWKVQMLEYGTGFSVPYFEGEKETVTPAFLADFISLVHSMHYNGKTTIEMGRAIAYDCGYYFTTVQDKKKNGDTVYVIVDGGIHQLNYDGQLRGIYKPFTEVLNDGNDAEEKSCICGSLCTTNDILMNAYEKKVKIGDVLVFKNTGAYSINEGMSTFLSHELPAVYLYQDNELCQLRKREEGYLLNLPQCNP